ncbi:hypothetical protein KC354_g3379 [Hortaea werneckii]|uniref:Uncharacterized protein n=1 Tax=Hortaea werneckii TaxID=91943 RepID=A0A3M7C329_HORWE|nr:hypothetical protein KC354_g3379 [Hortaea werneckii]RMY46455.1 hypothetical protein D0863_15840 [Hortaea werneckii]
MSVDGSSAAADISFTRLGNHNRNGESSSQADSRSRSSGKRSGETQRWSRGEIGSSHSRDIGSSHSHSQSHGTPSSRASTEGDSRRRHGHMSKKSGGGFLLDSFPPNGHARRSEGEEREQEQERERQWDRLGKRKAQDGLGSHLQVEKRRHGQNRFSTGSSYGAGGSPLSREVSMSTQDNDGTKAPRSASGSQHARSASMDPAQLVQMALELSESRRRQTSAPMHWPMGSPRDSRRVSALASGNHERPRSPGRPRASLGARDVSNNASAAAQPRQSIATEPASDQPASEIVPDHFSSATLARAEKARKYFELASEHRRLLESLPPLKADAEAPGNYTFVSTSSPHTPHPQIERVPSYQGHQHSLGRQYNPLQSLRNRRLRNRERRPLPAPLDAWSDTGRIHQWVDDVEAAAEDPEYRIQPDRVQLPPYEDDGEAQASLQGVTRGHRRGDTASSIVARPENGWSIEPSELLADTYWTEKDDNKELIENRHGNLVFSSRMRASAEQPRHSAEMRRPIAVEDDEDTSTDHVPWRKRTHRHTRLLPKRHRHMAHLNRSPSNTSVSSEEGAMHFKRSHPSDGGENIGPLAKHMQQMIAQDEKGEPTSTDMVSPDHWDSKRTQFPILRGHDGRPRRDTHSHGEAKTTQANGRLSVDSTTGHRRARSADGRFVKSDEPSELIENSPETVEAPSMGDVGLANLKSSPPSRNDDPSLERQKTNRSKLPVFGSRSKDRNNIGHTDFAFSPEKKTSSGEDKDPRSSQESSRPSFMLRHRTTESFSSSLRRQATHNTVESNKEPSSAMGRFFKGSRIGDLMRNESSRFGDRWRSKERLEEVADGLETMGSATEPSDEEDDHEDSGVKAGIGSRPSLERGGSKPKYNTPNLPSFTSQMERTKSDMSATKQQDGMTPEEQARRTATRSPRFDRLAPPRINLPTDSNPPTPGPATGQSTGDQSRKSYGFLAPEQQAGESRPSLVSGGSSRPESSASNKRLSEIKSGHRHWSISDRVPPEQPTPTRITPRDLARVKTLLLTSGIKSREIHRHANNPRPPTEHLPVIQDALTFVGKPDALLPSPSHPPIPIKEEHLHASALLSDTLSHDLQAFTTTLTTFQSGPAQSLSDNLDALLRKASDHLTKTCHDTSDDADAFIVDLTTRRPQEVKRVEDAIEELLRQRRRQFLLFRKIGFKLLEWVVLGIMWAVWGVVVLVNSVRRVVGWVWVVVKWLLSF